MNDKFLKLSEEHQMLRESLRQFATQKLEPQAEEHDRYERFNLKVFRELGELGVLGLTLSEEFGGADMDATSCVILFEELSSVDSGFALAVLAHSMLCVNNFYFNANTDQKSEILPKLASGEWVGAMGMSEPDAGTDVLSMSMTAEKKGSSYVLNGRKMWITNGCVDDAKTPCDVVLVYAKTGVNSKGRSEFSSFFVKKGDPGFSVGQKIMGKLGMRSSNTAELVFDNCEIPANQLIGNEGEALLHMMKNLEIERLTLAAMSLGMARRSLEIMIQYSKEREAFGKKISQFGQIQKFISESYAKYASAKAYVYMLAGNMSTGGAGQRIDSDGVKLVAATMAKEVCDNAIQVLGGYGYVSEYVVERLWRDAKLIEIGGGTLEAHQKNMTRDLCKDASFLLL